MTTSKKAPAKAAPKGAKPVAAVKKNTPVKPKALAKAAPKKAPVKAVPVKAKTKGVAAAPTPSKTKSASKPVAKAKPTVVKPKAAPAKGVKVAKPAKAVKPAKPAKAVKPAKPSAAPAKTVVAKPSVPKPSAVKESSKKTAAAPPVKSMTVSTREAVQAPTTPAPVTAAAPDQLVRAARPSARLAQITVPSLPPAVASTAAKSSFLPSTPSTTPNVPFAPIKKDPKLANNWKTKKVDQLTDSEILAMPDGEYMNDMQLAYFRRKLSLLKQDILNSAGATTEHLREDTVVVPDPADRATIEEEHALELRTRDRERKLLKKIEQSIQRIDAGDYGFCDETGEAIGVGRLLARPTATLSLEAQQRRELKQKMFGD